MIPITAFRKSSFVACGILISLLAATAISLPSVDRLMAKDKNDAPQQGESIPTGLRITPGAAKGSLFQALNPDLPGHPDFVVGQAVTTATSPNGKTLLILTSGFNSQNFTSGPNEGSPDPAQSNEYVFVYDISGSTPLKMQVLQIPNAFDGLAWNPSGKEFYVSGGPGIPGHPAVGDNIHVFDFDPNLAAWVEAAGSPVSLGHSGARTGSPQNFITSAPAGIAVTTDGTRLVAANYENDSLSIVDLVQRAKVAELNLWPGGGVPGGEYPFGVAIQGNSIAFVSSTRDREIVVVDISTNSPSVATRIPLRGEPTRMILDRKQTRLFVALSSSDSVAFIDTKSRQVIEEIPTVAPASIFPNTQGFKGAIPNSLAFSPNEQTLYVTNGGANDVAVIRLAATVGEKSAVIGLIPTGWYPNSVSTNADGSMLYVVNGKSNAGPNPQGCRDKGSLAIGNGIGPGAENVCNGANQYVWQLTKAGFLSLPTPRGDELQDLTVQVASNNHYLPDANRSLDAQVMAFLHQNVQHVIYIVRENRTYDQILGDLTVGNGDPSIVVYPQPVTPNQHALASRFVDLDNFYDSGEVSGDGWNWSTSARAADTIEKSEPINYAGRGLNYDYEGTNRNMNMGYATVAERQAANPLNPSDPDLLPGTADVSAPDSPEGDAGEGYLWDSALRAGLSIRNYGFFVDLTRYFLPASNPAAISPTITDPFTAGVQVAFTTKAALRPVTDPFFRGYDNKFPDFFRVNEWEREFHQFEESGNLPNLEFIRVMHDHTGSFGSAIDGVNTPELQTADNDYAVGRIVDLVSHSDAYKNNTLIFVIEDDSQDGPDHVDAHRSVAYVAGAYVRQGAVVSQAYTTVNMIRTIVDVLGIEHLGLYDATQRPMTDVFQLAASPWTFNAIVPANLCTTGLPLPPGACAAAKIKSSTDSLWAKYAEPLHNAAWWEAKTRGFDFSVEDRLDAPRYNRILWAGIVGERVPYPAARSGLNLRQNRMKLLEQFRRTRLPQIEKSKAQSGG